jgi:prepilin signal peptidase PulO-like enzyme (type II secretory pathway)
MNFYLFYGERCRSLHCTSSHYPTYPYFEVLTFVLRELQGNQKHLQSRI